MASAFDRLLDFSQPFDVALLDQVVMAMYQSRDDAQRRQINAFMTAFQEHPQSWTRVDTILETTQCEQSKFFALATLENCVKYRWKVLPPDQRELIKAYIVNVIIRYSSDEATLQRTKMCLGKLNLILVQILKQEWPHNWKDFIPQLVESGKTNETLCGNNMDILKKLSEEVFEFSLKQLTSRKVDQLKESLTQEFQLIYQLCEFVMGNAKNPTTISTTLQCFLRFLFWIPLVYIFETALIDMLLHKFFPQPAFRCDALQCLAEIAAIDPRTVDAKYHPRIQKMYADFITNLSAIVPPNAVRQFHQQGDAGEEFVQRLTLFLSTILKTHLPILETQELLMHLMQGLQYLVNISEVDDDEIFKICTEYWNFLADDLYHKEVQMQRPMAALMLSPTPVAQSPRLQTYSPILAQARRILIDRMPKPEEVLVVEDENGEVVKEHLKDVEVVALHKTVRETLVFLTHLDHQQTEEVMIEKLGQQVHPAPGGQGWSRQRLSTLCWAIGSISGAMREDDEKRFLVHVIKDLLGLCEVTRGKDNKAVIASNIMYVVGQYPRFLRAHWKFLKTVVNKLFEFMHETHPGVQDMACETFLKICQRCKQQFVKHQPQEQSPFIDQLLIGSSTVADIGSTIADLEAHQVNMFYEAVGCIVSAEQNPTKRDEIIQELFRLPNARWLEIIGLAMQDPTQLQNQDTMRSIAKILQINVRVSSSLGHPYIIQLAAIYERMLQVYKMYSEAISASVAANALSAKTSGVRLMRAVKRETLRLIETTVDRSEDMPRLVEHFVPPLVDYVLADYQSNHPDTRDPEVLSLFAAVVGKAGDLITAQVPRVLGAVFDCTLAMITQNMEDYPEHRINFFQLLKEINHACFRAFFMIPAEAFRVLIDAIVWAIKHRERNIADAGLSILLEMLRNLDGAGEVAGQFYLQFALTLTHDMLAVLTDKEHEPGFKLQCAVLQHMLSRIVGGLPAAPLFSPAEHPGITSNTQFIRLRIQTTLREGFGDRLTPGQLDEVVTGLLDPSKDAAAFQTLARDFLIQLKEFNSDQWTECSLSLQLEQQHKEAERVQAEMARMQVPGLMPVTMRNYDDPTDPAAIAAAAAASAAAAALSP
uniref:Exportin-1 n=1 Tax=Cryptomonas curvata TaxID=233186 RepID=A0A7S0M413_9CRYP